MAGQGTIGLEILAELPDVSAIIVPVGGGGLIAGVASAVRHAQRQIRIFGVQTAAAPAVHFSLKKGSVTETPVGPSLADGIAVKKPSEAAFGIIRECVDDVLLVTEEEIAQVIVQLLERGKLLTEGAGAVPLAALLSKKTALPSGNTVCLLSGGNIDVKTLAMVVERELVAGGRFLKLRLVLDAIPGSLARLADDLAHLKATIYYISHDRRDITLPLGKTDVVVELETRGFDRIRTILNFLEGKGYDVAAKK